MFKIAHISDLHFNPDFQQQQVIDALCEDLKTQGKDEPFDALIFSGDIAAKGEINPAISEIILGKFISALKNSIGSTTPILICPGNHDINLKRRNEIYQPVFERVNSSEEANKLTSKAEDSTTAAIWSHIADFRSLASAIDSDAFSKSPIFYTKKIQKENLTIGFACLNSAWMTKGGGNQDLGRLYLGEGILDTARKELNDTDFKIAIFHHPLDWFAVDERANIQRYLIQNFDGLFNGHMHDTNATSLHTNSGTLFINNTGCIYQTRDYFNGYSITEIDLTNRKWIINAREFYLTRSKFGKAERFSEGGRWEVEFSNKHTSSCIPISIEATKAINERGNAQLLSHTASDIAPKSVNAMFVEPPLSKMSEKEVLAKSKNDAVDKNAYLSIQQISSNEKSIFFLGKREAGKSLLLHHIAINRFSSFKNDARLGLVFDLSSAPRLTTATLLQQGVEFCGGEINRSDLKSLLNAGEVIVCIDNVKTREEAHAKLISQFISEYPRCRYIFAGSEEIVDDLSGNALPDLPIECERIFVHSFRNRHTKELVARWFGSNDLALNQRIKNINNLFDRLRVPRTPFLVSVLSWVLEQRPNANVINKASAIEVLLEGLLEKFKESKSRKEVDSNIQQDFLTEFAFHLDNVYLERINRIDFDQFAVTYIKKRGLNIPIDGLSSELLRKGLLHSSDDSISFKFDCFRAYFLSRKFADNNELLKKALTPALISRYSTELDLFTGINRNRIDILRMAKSMCEDSFQLLEFKFDPTAFDKITDPTLFADKLLLEKIETSLDKNEVHLEKEKNELPDTVSADHEAARKRHLAPEVSDVTRFIESLRAFSMILRNSELVADVNLKAECFESALDHWAKTMVAAVVSLTELSNEQNSSDKPKENENSKLSKKIMTPFVKAMVPQMIISIMCEALSTPKLELFIKEKISDKRILVRLLAVFLNLGNSEAENESLAAVKSLFNDFRGNGFILEMLFLRLLHAYLNTELSARSAKPLRDLIGDIMIELRGGGINESALIKSRLLNGLDKRLLVIDESNK
jgi:predicted MPP superfamily phosphohydrolase